MHLSLIIVNIMYYLTVYNFLANLWSGKLVSCPVCHILYGIANCKFTSGLRYIGIILLCKNGRFTITEFLVSCEKFL